MYVDVAIECAAAARDVCIVILVHALYVLATRVCFRTSAGHVLVTKSACFCKMDAGTWIAVLGTILAVLVTTLLLLLKVKTWKKSTTSRSAVGAKSKNKWSHIRIFYGTQTETAKRFAEALSAELSSCQVVEGEVSVVDLRQCGDPEETLTQQVRTCVCPCIAQCGAVELRTHVPWSSACSVLLL